MENQTNFGETKEILEEAFQNPGIKEVMELFCRFEAMRNAANPYCREYENPKIIVSTGSSSF